MPNLVNDLKHAPRFEWCMVDCEYKNIDQKDSYVLEEIGLHAQTLLTIPNTIIIIIGGGDLYNHLWI